MAMLPKPMERESIYSLISRTCDLYRITGKDFAQYFLDKPSLFLNECSQLRFAKTIYDIIYKQDSDTLSSFDIFLNNHSDFKYVTSFYTQKQRIEIFEHLAQPIPEIQRKYIARLSSFGGRFFEDKVICPKCLKKQIQNHGIYWRRIEWSMYGMDICPKHGCRMLLDNSFRSLKSVEISLQEKKYVEQKNKKTELWVENISLLINKKCPEISPIQVVSYLKEQFGRKMLSTEYITAYNETSRRVEKKGFLLVNKEDLIDNLSDFWGDDFIRHLTFFRHQRSLNRYYAVDSVPSLLSNWVYLTLILLFIEPKKNIIEIMKDISKIDGKKFGIPNFSPEVRKIFNIYI